MKKLTLVLCLLSSTALADASRNYITKPQPACSDATTCITAVGTDASRSFKVDNTIQGTFAPVGSGLLLVWVALTDANDSVTGVSLACTGSYDDNTTDFRIPSCPWDSVNLRFNCESGSLFWNPSDETSADIKYQVFRYDVEGIEDLECTFTFTNGAAGDTITARQSFAVKG